MSKRSVTSCKFVKTPCLINISSSHVEQVFKRSNRQTNSFITKFDQFEFVLTLFNWHTLTECLIKNFQGCNLSCADCPCDVTLPTTGGYNFKRRSGVTVKSLLVRQKGTPCQGREGERERGREGEGEGVDAG